jgi:uncharacterized protein
MLSTYFMQLRFRQVGGSFAVCRFPSDAAIPVTMGASFISVTRTADELSIVCPADHVPQNIRCEAPWTCFKLEGPFAFTLTGVLASFLDPLAKAGVSIFAVSTFDTDYVLVKQESGTCCLEGITRCRA